MQKAPAQRLSGMPGLSQATTSVPEAEPEQDLFADPRHTSQMTAVFTQHYAREQMIQEVRRAADAKRMANDVRARNGVIVYGWAQVSIICALQCCLMIINPNRIYFALYHPSQVFRGQEGPAGEDRQEGQSGISNIQVSLVCLIDVTLVGDSLAQHASWCYIWRPTHRYRLG